MNTCRSKAETVLREFVKKVQLMRFAQKEYDPCRTSIDDLI